MYTYLHKALTKLMLKSKDFYFNVIQNNCTYIILVLKLFESYTNIIITCSELRKRYIRLKCVR